MERDKKNENQEGKFKSIFKREKFVHFLDRQGFYVVLFICICVIGVTALFTTRDRDRLNENRDKDGIVEYDDEEPMLDSDIYMRGLYSDLHSDSVSDDKDSNEVDKEASTGDSVDIKVEDVLTDDKPKEKEEQTKESESKEDKPKQKETDVNNDKAKSAESEAKPVTNPQKEEKPISGKVAQVTMLKPVQGNAIICDYAQDELVYSSTLKEWRTHPGIDIECPLGSEVKAVLDGSVQSIEEDPLMGITITVDHGGGISTKYANLSTKEMVQVGQKVKEGQVISGIGRTATAEILDAPHLHFEVIVDGRHVDPKKFFE